MIEIAPDLAAVSPVKGADIQAKDDEGARLLVTIPGVGYYGALLIKSETGDINRFPSANSFTPMLGSFPPHVPPETLLTIGT